MSPPSPADRPERVPLPRRRAALRGARFVAMLAFVVAATVVGIPLTNAPDAEAHGWVTSPPSRQDHCANGTVDFGCGGLEYEPQSVEAPKGSTLCSGGSQYSVLDDESLPWPRTSVDSTVTMRWQLTAQHSTSTWEYFVDGQLFDSFDNGGAKPPSTVTHTLSGLPAGEHTILARWNIADTVNAFYACVDVTVGGGGAAPTSAPPSSDPAPTEPAPTSTPPPTSTPAPPTSEPTDPGDAPAPAWDPTAVYTYGDRVTYDGRLYEAKWWTTGEVPPESGEWDVWKDLGAY